MTKFKLVMETASIKYRDRYEISSGVTTTDLGGRDHYPEFLQYFDNEQEALRGIGTIKTSIEERSSQGMKYFMIREYYIRKDIYDEDGEWVAGDILGFSQMPEDMDTMLYL